MNPVLLHHICLHCSAGFIVLECARFDEEKGVCEGCEVSHGCRQCGSDDTRLQTKEERALPRGPSRALYQCGDCALSFKQLQCASHLGDGTTCADDCACDGADKDAVHRCPMCFTLNAHYIGPSEK